MISVQSYYDNFDVFLDTILFYRGYCSSSNYSWTSSNELSDSSCILLSFLRSVLYFLIFYLGFIKVDFLLNGVNKDSFFFGGLRLGDSFS